MMGFHEVRRCCSSGSPTGVVIGRFWTKTLPDDRRSPERRCPIAIPQAEQLCENYLDELDTNR